MAEQRRRGDILPYRTFSTTEQSILRLAADIMDVPLDQLISIRAANSTLTSSNPDVHAVPSLIVNEAANSDNLPLTSVSAASFPSRPESPQNRHSSSSIVPDPRITDPGLVGLHDHGWVYKRSSEILEEVSPTQSRNSQSNMIIVGRLNASDLSTSPDVVLTPESDKISQRHNPDQPVASSSAAIENTNNAVHEEILMNVPVSDAGNTLVHGGHVSNDWSNLDHITGQAFDVSHAGFGQQRAAVDCHPNFGADPSEDFQQDSMSHWSLLGSNFHGAGDSFPDSDASLWLDIEAGLVLVTGSFYQESQFFPIGNDSHLLIMGPPMPPDSIHQSGSYCNWNQMAPPQNGSSSWNDMSNPFGVSEQDVFLQFKGQRYGPSQNDDGPSIPTECAMFHQGVTRQQLPPHPTLGAHRSLISQDPGFTVGPSAESRALIEETNIPLPRAARQESQNQLLRTVILGSPRIQKTGAKESGPFSTQERQLTTSTKNLTACLRCQLQCIPNDGDPHGTCQACARITGPVIPKMPCLRYKIEDSTFVVQKQSPEQYWSKRWLSMKLQEIETWADSATHVIVLTQDVGTARDILRVRRIIPQEGDSLQRTWLSHSSGERKYHDCAPYAIENLHEAAIELKAALSRDIPEYIAHYIEEKDLMLRSTYDMAYKQSKIAKTDKERKLLSNILLLWVGVRYDSKPSRICGEDTLGMEPQNKDRERHDYGQFPVSPVISAQCSLLTSAAVIDPLHEDIRRDLAWFFESKQRRTEAWFTIYLSIFIILHNYALITKYYEKKARNLRLHSRYAATAVLEKLHGSANILLAYFHYCTPGSLPFAKGWNSDDDIARCHLKGEQVQFLQQTSEELKNKASSIKEIRSEAQFENDFYFLSQLFDLGWEPSSRTING